MSLELMLTLMALTGVAPGFTLWRERRPAEPFKPKLVPWLFLSMTLLVILLVLTGVQIKGRFGATHQVSRTKGSHYFTDAIAMKAGKDVADLSQRVATRRRSFSP